MTVTLTPAPYALPGDLIQTANGALYRVVAVKKVNYGVVDEDGRNWNLRKTGAFEAPAGAVFSGPSTADVFDPRLDVTLGSVVEFKAGRYAGTGKYVVIRVGGNGTFSVAKLGGDGGQYIRGVRGINLETVDAD